MHAGYASCVPRQSYLHTTNRLLGNQSGNKKCIQHHRKRCTNSCYHNTTQLIYSFFSMCSTSVDNIVNVCVHKHVQYKTQRGNCPIFFLETQLPSVQPTMYNIVTLLWAASSNRKSWCDGQYLCLTFVKFREQKFILFLMVFNRAGGRIREQSSK